MKKIPLLINALLIPFLAWSAHAQPIITAEKIWIREAPPTIDVLAAYMTLHNPTDQDITLICVKSPAFTDIMFHKTEIVNDIAKMRHADEIIIPAHTSFDLAPGGFHMMLMGKKYQLKKGDEVELTLIFKKINNKKIIATVKKSITD